MSYISSAQKKSYVAFIFILFVVIGFWIQARGQKVEWLNVPPVPSLNAAKNFALGDAQASYRGFGIALQNLGNTGGNTARLNDYDFEALGRWFFLVDKLDPRSNFAPMLAAYYYGGTTDADQLDPIIDYLSIVGQRAGREKWRWLAHAVYLSRFKQNDLDKALNLSYILANLKNRDELPHWAVQMPAFIMAQQGEKEAAVEMLLDILKEDYETMHPNEINFTVDYICNRVLDKAAAQKLSLCNDIK